MNVSNLSQKANKNQLSGRLIQLLIKLNNKYHQTRSGTLMIKLIPSAAEAYGILLQEQVHHEISKNIFNEDQDSMVCRVEKRNTYDNRNKGYMGGKKQSNAFFCEHCKISGHTKTDVGSYMAILQNTNIILGGRKIK